METAETSAKRRKLNLDSVEESASAAALLEADDCDDAVHNAPQSFKDAFKNLPEHFRKYLLSNGVPEDAYDVPALSRFVRVNPKKNVPTTAADLNQQFLGSDSGFKVLDEVAWMNEAVNAGAFFKLDAAAPLSRLQAYKDGSIYGIDLSSAAAVAALDVQPHHHVLDLCCAPGAKLACIFDRMWAIYAKENPSVKLDDESKLAPFTGTVTGVDVSAHRIQACRSLCQKYRLSRVRLFLCDGSQFYSLAADPTAPLPHEADPSSSVFLPPLPADILAEVGPPAEPDSTVAASEPSQLSKKVQRKLNKKLKKQPTDLEHLSFCSDYRIRTGSRLLYDRVIIDAPCTLDASIRHLLLHGKVGWLDENGTVDVHITNLQKRLIYNGARLLASGGILVYSTCSFCKGQNEDVVEWLLSKMPGCFELVPLDFPEPGKTIASPSSLQHCVRFYPKHSGTSGMFISKLRKKEDAPTSRNLIRLGIMIAGKEFATCTGFFVQNLPPEHHVLSMLLETRRILCCDEGAFLSPNNYHHMANVAQPNVDLVPVDSFLPESVKRISAVSYVACFFLLSACSIPVVIILATANWKNGEYNRVSPKGEKSLALPAVVPMCGQFIPISVYMLLLSILFSVTPFRLRLVRRQTESPITWLKIGLGISVSLGVIVHLSALWLCTDQPPSFYAVSVPVSFACMAFVTNLAILLLHVLQKREFNHAEATTASA